MHADGERAGKRTGPHHAHEDDGIHKLGERAQHIAHELAHTRHHRVVPKGARAHERKGDGEHRRDRRAQKRDAYGEQKKADQVLAGAIVDVPPIRAEQPAQRLERERRVEGREPGIVEPDCRPGHHGHHHDRDRDGTRALGCKQPAARGRSRLTHASLLLTASLRKSTTATTTKIMRMITDTRS